MSHHSGDDALLVASSDSFWEPGNYKKTTKRIEDGNKLCHDLITLITERGEIERTYAKSLRNWAKKWSDLIEKGPEYGTTEAAWKAVLVEADRKCELQTRIKERLHQEVLANIKHWQKESFHKSMMTVKEKKEMDDAFKKAQKPWAKILAKVNKAKNDYHLACKNERSAVNQERNAGADSSLSPDQVRKLQEKVSKSKDEVQKTKDRYEMALQEIKEYNAKYMEDMTVVFDKCQELEEKRLVFLKEMLFGIHSCLNICDDEELPQIYEEYKHTINNADSAKDLKWWSNNHGVAMGMNWPTFEEYSEEFRDISGKSKRNTVSSENTITLINQRGITEDLPEYAPELHKISTKEKKINQVTTDGSVTLTNINQKNQSENKTNTDKSNRTSTVSSNGKADNPFDEDHDEWDEYGGELVDNGEAGVAVRALYDYDGAEGDELNLKQGITMPKITQTRCQKGSKQGIGMVQYFAQQYFAQQYFAQQYFAQQYFAQQYFAQQYFAQQYFAQQYFAQQYFAQQYFAQQYFALVLLYVSISDVFEKLEDEDEQGWCKGRKDGVVGLYPANYVEVI
ncbi:Protein kinase C and casein kinase substrate in neurons protein 2 [Nymphon striatum]|nr:Protein kinase C and casein kinase substrate in neurons protein 2 [Nymphon striatum]